MTADGSNDHMETGSVAPDTNTIRALVLYEVCTTLYPTVLNAADNSDSKPW